MACLTISKMSNIAIIAEGETDHAVLANILVGYLGDPDFVPNYLQPALKHGPFDPLNSGGWSKVIEYCSSNRFLEAFQYSDYVIVQIDSDVADGDRIKVPTHTDGSPDTVDQKCERIRGYLIDVIGHEIAAEFGHRIIFAICVDCVECWLLPIYYPTDTKARSKTTGCGRMLERSLGKASMPYVKGYRQYLDYSKAFRKLDKGSTNWNHNPSLRLFIDGLAVIE